MILRYVDGEVLKASDYVHGGCSQSLDRCEGAGRGLTLVLALVDVHEPSLQLGFGSVLAVAFLLQSRLDLQSAREFNEWRATRTREGGTYTEYRTVSTSEFASWISCRRASFWEWNESRSLARSFIIVRLLRRLRSESLRADSRVLTRSRLA